MWIMLEAMLFGSLLLYQTVVVRYFEPSLVTCLAEPWFRELGFAIFYGSIVLKVYRILAEFQSRKAHRVCVRDKDLLKYLLGIVLVVMCYMAAWTAVVMDNITRGHDIIDQHETLDGLKYFTCRALWWDYVTEGGEFLFLLLGIYLTYCIRNARKEFYREKWPLSAAICIETVVSVTTHTVRRVMWLSLGQDYLFFLHFLRCQLTVTCILTIIFGPKLWYHHRPSDPNRHLSCDIQDHVPDSLKLHEAIMSNGEVDLVEINLTDMDPEDIRAELRRVYTQLQALRNKTMRKDNPHISKRRGGRKVTHRRFSLQPFHHKHKPHHDHDHEITEVSKTPEDSVASIEVAPGQIEGTSTRNDDVVSTPTVSFKTGLK
ncbi:metabotropic glycine receptor-like isoform X1 [Tachypleus tridentatus]|uniref:metabotropic glycine receptor-like isoform X1 n=1 Tax=Tachypleus tridentatus TaxID=6853 RepID=UPI003FD08703